MDININEKIGIRELVEFVLKGGDLVTTSSNDHSAQEGTRIHHLLQKKWPATIAAEVDLKGEFTHAAHTIQVHGRADGVRYADHLPSEILEIKTSPVAFKDLTTNTLELYWSQAKFYAHLLLTKYDLPQLKITLIYYQTTTKQITEKSVTVSRDQVKVFTNNVIASYAVWLDLVADLHRQRDQAITQLKFPFSSYHQNQHELAAAVYRTIASQKKLLVEAPTGTGKTISTLFPAIKALGAGLCTRIFYLTAKRSTRMVARDTIKLLHEHGLNLHMVVLTAKDQIIFKEERDLADEDNPFLLGYYDRIRPALLDILQHEQLIDPETIWTYARKHTVDPFEYSLDISLFCDVVICDYNYLFYPLVYLQRFFTQPDPHNVFLVDEAHNLIDRSRQMYTKEISSAALVPLLSQLKDQPRRRQRLIHLLERVLDSFDALKITLQKYHQETLMMTEAATDFNKRLDTFCEFTSDWLKEHQQDELYDEIKDYFLTAHAFLKINDYYGPTFRTRLLVVDDELTIRTICLDSSHLLADSLNLGGGTVLFSATLSPLPYYREMFGLDDDTNQGLLYQLPSPFASDHLGLFVTNDIQTTYQKRPASLGQVSATIYQLLASHPGNYLIFLPSYSYLEQVVARFNRDYPEIATVCQTGTMDNEARTNFLANFVANPTSSLVGFAVLGGMFAEGIDLQGSRLAGVAIVSVGLPRINPETDELRKYFTAHHRDGFQYAYQLPGLNNVFQAAGRVIRGEDDVGVVVLIDQRFASPRYTQFYPPHWQHFQLTNSPQQLQLALKKFWHQHTD